MLSMARKPDGTIRRPAKHLRAGVRREKTSGQCAAL